MDCRQATADLNEAVNRALAGGISIAGAVYPVMHHWRGYGASDSEPFTALREIYEATGATAEDFNREIRAAMSGGEDLFEEPPGPKR